LRFLITVSVIFRNYMLGRVNSNFCFTGSWLALF
jgi:hypothetical protein